MNIIDVMVLLLIIYYTVVFFDSEENKLMVLSEIVIFILAALIKNNTDVFDYLDSFFIKVMFGKTKDIETIDQAIPPSTRSIFYILIFLIVLICCFQFFIFVYRCIRENVEEHRRRGGEVNEKDV